MSLATTLQSDKDILASGKNVIVIGGGDTEFGLHRHVSPPRRQKRHYARALTETAGSTYIGQPVAGVVARVASFIVSQRRGRIDYSVLTKKFTGENGQVRKLHGVRIEWKRDEKGQMKMVEAPGSEFELDAELVLLAMGFVHPVHEGMIQQLGVNLDPRGNVMVDANHMTSKEGVFAAGDMAIGQSLVVRAIKQGRNAAKGIDKYLMGETQLS